MNNISSPTNDLGPTTPKSMSEAKGQKTKKSMSVSVFERVRSAVQGSPEVREEKKQAREEFNEIIRKIDYFYDELGFGQHFLRITKNAFMVEEYQKCHSKIRKLYKKCKSGKPSGLQAAKIEYDQLIKEADALMKKQINQIGGTISTTTIVPVTVVHIHTQPSEKKDDFFQDATHPQIQGTQDQNLQDLNRKVDERILKEWDKSRGGFPG